MAQPFRNRIEAGRRLAQRFKGRTDLLEAVVLGLPRGGLPIGFEIARVLQVPLDVFLVRKLGVPGQEELAMGAIASGGAQVLNEDVVLTLGVPDVIIKSAAARELQEIERRERIYRAGRPPLDVSGRTVIVTDDGLATGATMRAAVQAFRARNAARVIVAVPVAPVETFQQFQREVDEVICLMTPSPFFAIGQWYGDFSQLTDEEVCRILDEAARLLPHAAKAGSTAA